LKKTLGIATNDLALNATFRTIEINLRESVGEDHRQIVLLLIDNCM
jgi:predicted membrane chloride channel (bestrophin family)